MAELDMAKAPGDIKVTVPRCSNQSCLKKNPSFNVRKFPMPDNPDWDIGVVFCGSCGTIWGAIAFPKHKSPLAL